MAKLSWIQPICDACYEQRFPYGEPTRVKDLKERKPRRYEPVRVKEYVSETCVDCGYLVAWGIYVRVKPELAEFPTRLCSSPRSDSS